ncbi:hypothetical protein HOO65_020799 [Ceratocystis lukuohia]|uniref:Uncharacterized protein n=1 Tax=Ceratocystis lukuohia TaxID=2019550 RepID=A0ABR4MPP8_9PEZI
MSMQPQPSSRSASTHHVLASVVAHPPVSLHPPSVHGSGPARIRSWTRPRIAPPPTEPPLLGSRRLLFGCKFIIRRPSSGSSDGSQPEIGIHGPILKPVSQIDRAEAWGVDIPPLPELKPVFLWPHLRWELRHMAGQDAADMPWVRPSDGIYLNWVPLSATRKGVFTFSCGNGLVWCVKKKPVKILRIVQSSAHKGGGSGGGGGGGSSRGSCGGVGGGDDAGGGYSGDRQNTTMARPRMKKANLTPPSSTGATSRDISHPPASRLLLSLEPTVKSHRSLTARGLHLLVKSLGFDDPSTTHKGSNHSNSMLANPPRKLSSNSNFDETESESIADTLFSIPSPGTSIPDDLLSIASDQPQEVDMEPFPSYDDSGFVFPDLPENGTVCTSACCKSDASPEISLDISPMTSPQANTTQLPPLELSRRLTELEVTLSRCPPSASASSKRPSRSTRSSRIITSPQRRSPKRSKLPPSWLELAAPPSFSPKKAYDPTPYKSPGERRKKARKKMKDRASVLVSGNGGEESESRFVLNPTARHGTRACKKPHAKSPIEEPERFPLLVDEQTRKGELNTWEPSTTGLLFGAIAIVFLCFWIVDMIYSG